ncbi:hypothetical protein M1146_03770, partial [Patescibacteria group bacterium]|nr:hypothetical protein [Patescibacteria group bacterium]
MDVFLRIIWGIVLNDPIYLWDIKTSGSYIGTKEDSKKSIRIKKAKLLHTLVLLFTFLKKNMKRKIIVFFSSCAAVTFYAELLNYIDVGVLS